MKECLKMTRLMEKELVLEQKKFGIKNNLKIISLERKNGILRYINQNNVVQ